MKIEGSTIFKCCTAGHELVKVRVHLYNGWSNELMSPEILLVKLYQSFSKSLLLVLSFRLGIALSPILSNRILWVQVWVHMHLPQLNPMISLPRMSISKELAILQNPNNISPTSPGTAIIIIAFFLSNKKWKQWFTLYTVLWNIIVWNVPIY